jgi:lipopolysaccharide transport system ATP-binding protein
MSSLVSLTNVTVRFPLHGADSRSLKKHLARVTVGGSISNTAMWGQTITALEDANLCLHPGDRLGLIGPNGAGKTTLLRCIAGAYEPDSGRVEVHGRLAALLDINMGIDPGSTGYQNIRLRGLIAGLTPAEIDEKTDEIASFTGLGPFLDLPVKAYSAGMGARLAFAVTTAIEADIVLLDEWLSVGDAEFQLQAHERLSGLVNSAHILVFASHNLELVRSLCNKVIRIEGGRVSPMIDISQLDQLAA